MVNQPLPPHPLADARAVQQVDRALFQHSRADALFHVFPAVRLDHHRLDTLQVQQVREQ